jgi:hypothetical protein|tara:strand:+ start:349 stop:585 length:237 start_codon:yes stop_codon:yes gene_type:complete
MEYIVVKRTKLHGNSDDLMSIQKTAKTLDDAVKFKVALEMLDSGERISYHILIDTHDAYTYLTTEQPEENQDKVVNIK